ncbi:MAG TPA: ParB/RepB/Spo0J family partition protein [Vicinamibacterales bacterium]|jgi:ParB family chromosome partitioning protein
MEKRPALGKGLSALIPDAPEVRPAPVEVDIDLLAPNRYQPRGVMDEAALAELADSIRANGIIQPIVVRTVDGGRYEIIAGERRWRAAQRAGLHRVPVAVKQVEAGHEKALLEMALVENVQRADLNPVEEALAYRRLANDFNRTQDEIAVAVGKDRATVANYMRLLKLPEELRAELAAGRLSMGHARALLALGEEAQQRNLSREIIARSLSVRETEALVRKLTGDGDKKPEARETKPKADVHTRAAEEQLRLSLGTSVRIVRRGSRGRIEIDFVSEDELIRIYDHLTDGKHA